MRTLIDDILAEGKVDKSAFASYTMVDISSASYQFHTSFPMDKHFCTHDVARNIAPPMDSILFYASEPPEGREANIGRFCVGMQSRDVRDEPPYPGVKWILFFTVIAEYQGIVGRFSDSILMHVNEDGSMHVPSERQGSKDQWFYSCIQDDPENSSFPDRLQVFHTQDDFMRKKLQSIVMDWFIAPCLFALDLLHTKNVTLEKKHRVMPKSKKVRRRYGKLPDFDHHTIVIRDQRGNVVDHQEMEAAIARGMHRVRGHFSTYTPDKPLFGKVSGRFWIPAHIRRLMSDRLITSDYRFGGNSVA